MTEPKRSYEEWQQIAADNPERYSVKNGVVSDLQAPGGAKIIASFNSHKLVPMTPEKSRELHARRQAQKLKARIGGRINAIRKEYPELDIPDPSTLTDEDFVIAEGEADFILSELYTLAFIRAAKDGKNFRGLTEGVREVLERVSEDPKQAPPPSGIQITTDAKQLAELLDQLDRHDQIAVDRAHAIEGVAK